MLFPRLGAIGVDPCVTYKGLAAGYSLTLSVRPSELLRGGGGGGDGNATADTKEAGVGHVDSIVTVVVVLQAVVVIVCKLLSNISRLSPLAH